MNNFFYSQTQTRRRKVASMKHLVRCCRLYETARIRQILGRIFVLHGRTHTYYDPGVDCSQPDPMLELSRTARDRTVVLTRASWRVRQWIRQATAGLCLEAKKRIATEITAHCQDGLRALEASGVSRETAEARVLEGLGDPVKANAAFHKTYLTPQQEQYLDWVFHVGPTHWHTLFIVVLLCCGNVFLETAGFLGRAVGGGDTSYSPGSKWYFVYILMMQFVGGPRIAWNLDCTDRRIIEDLRRWEGRCARWLSRNSTWFLFAVLCCLDAFRAAWLWPSWNVVPSQIVMVLFLYGTVHRAFIRDIVTLLPASPRARTHLMLEYGAILLGLVPVTMVCFRWIAALGPPGGHDELYMTQALPIVLGLLWFGGHALVGAFFVGKARPVGTPCRETEPERMGPA